MLLNIKKTVSGRNGIIQNSKKFIFGTDTIEFSGLEIMPDSIHPSQSVLRTITDFPTPSNITDTHWLFGLVNQVTYTFSMTMQLFHKLLKPSSKFCCDDKLQLLFEIIKEMVATS